MAKFYDTILGEYIKNPGKKGLGLDKLADYYLDYQTMSYDEITSKQKINFKEVSLDIALKYSAEDVYITAKIYEIQKKENTHTQSILTDIEIPLLEVLVDMEIVGVKIDEKILKEIGEKLKIQIEIEKKAIFGIAKKEFNINSPKQVGELLFVDMGLPHSKKTKTGYSVDFEVLETLAIKYPIAKHISNYRQYSKLLSTYIEGLLKIISKETNKIHTSYNQTITTTGRLSSTNPNLQNIPVSSGIAGEIRKAFIPLNTGDKIMAFDYSQVEVRILAIISKDDNLLGSFIKDADIHATTGSFLFGKDTLTNDERKIAKAVNFGVIYGISAFGLSKMIGISMGEAREYIDKFYEKYPKVKQYFNKVIEECRQKGYTSTMFGRKRFISNINDRNNIIKKAAEREAMNMPIQGTAADIIKLAMIKISKFLKNNNLKSCMIMQVHDEIVFNVKSGEENILKKEIKNIMENILDAPIKLKVDIGIGDNWRDVK